MRRRYQTAINSDDITANFPSSALTDSDFLDPIADVDEGASQTWLQEDEYINLSTVTTDDGYKLLDLKYAFARAYDDTVSGNDAIEAWESAEKTGEEFTIIPEDQDFGTDDVLECRVYERTGRVDLKASQLTAFSVTTLYMTYYYHASWHPASERAYQQAELKAVQEHLLDGERLTVTGGGSIDAKRLGYINYDNKRVYAFTDPGSEAQCAGLVYCPSAVTEGVSTQVIIKGVFTPDVTPLVGRPIFAGNNGQFTWNDDTSGNELTSGDYYRTVGFSYDGAKLWFNAVQEFSRKKP